MSDDDKRKFERTDSLNILEYVILGEDGEPTGEGMGRTLNVSENGLLLETNNLLDPEQILVITVGLEEDMVELRGKVTHVESYSDKTFCSGIEFEEIDENGKRVLDKFLEAHKKSKDK